MKKLILFFVTVAIIVAFDIPQDIGLPFMLEKPNKLKKGKLYPLIVCFHGAGGRGDDNSGKGSEAFRVLKQVVNDDKYKSFVFMAQCPVKQQWVDTSWRDGNYKLAEVKMSNELDWVNKKLDSIVKHYPIDPDRIYVTGQSMGGFATWDIISRYPNKFACAIPVCGGGDTTQVKKFKHLPVWAFHGDSDNVVPVSTSRELYKSAKVFNDNIHYTEFKNIAHNSWKQAWQNDTIISWMFKQKRHINTMHK